ncbi:helix-turn-helix domain-containing protein [Vibrio sp. NTOU-M3]|uniref:helix-turn-helix domain-containing protein n=1 Tax=Vibrio sp. NTOU-M3 TaxID=3234954 RepID=UPI00349FCC33
MNVLHKGYWIGKSISFVPRDMMFQIEKYFHIVENGHDVSVLSEADIQFCFFFFEPYTNHPLLITAVKICQNLNKKLIVIHKGQIAKEILDLEVVYNHFDIENGKYNDWIENMSRDVYFHFKNSKNIIDIHKDKSLFEQHSINKDIIEILRYIEQNLEKTIREEDIADYCHYSVTYFSKLFHKSVGMSFRDYLISKRISLAKQLLVEDRKTKIAFIAFQCGYKDVSYFSRIFKKKTGLTPAIYRQLH